MTKEMKNRNDFVGEIISKVLKKLPNTDDWKPLQREILEWQDGDFEWIIETHYLIGPAYHIYCSNWKTTIKQKMKKAEKRKNTINKNCIIIPRKYYDDGVKGDIFDGDYVFTNIFV